MAMCDRAAVLITSMAMCDRAAVLITSIRGGPIAGSRKADRPPYIACCSNPSTSSCNRAQQLHPKVVSQHDVIFAEWQR